MSAASIVSGSPSIARTIEMPDGPPAPVTSTRGWSGTGDLLRGGDGRAVAVAHDLQRLDVARLREARPVARGRPQQLFVEVAADVDLRRVRADDLDLAVEELVDRDEARRLEVDGRRRRLVAEQALDATRGDERRVVRVAMVLVDVADRVRVDDRRLNVLHHLQNRPDRGPAFTDAGVGEPRVNEPRAHQVGGLARLLRATGRGPVGLPTGQRQQRR